jgi:MFS transporter, NNP family, nitrate/nitrite transporter
MSPLLFLTLIFLVNFTGRVIFAPLMPTLEREVSITHGQAGALFFLITLGYFISILSSGFISSRLPQKDDCSFRDKGGPWGRVLVN